MLDKDVILVADAPAVRSCKFATLLSSITGPIKTGLLLLMLHAATRRESSNSGWRSVRSSGPGEYPTSRTNALREVCQASGPENRNRRHGFCLGRRSRASRQARDLGTAGGGLFGTKNVTIPDKVVGADGGITVPFAGRVRWEPDRLSTCSTRSSSVWHRRRSSHRRL